MKTKICLLAFFVTLIFTSCNLIDFSSTSSRYAAPSVTSDNEKITLSMTVPSTTKYINVFRYEYDTTTSSIIAETCTNIGQLTVNMATWTTSGKTGQFFDYFVDPTKTYVYQARYNNFTYPTYQSDPIALTDNSVTTIAERIVSLSDSTAASLAVNYTSTTANLYFDATKIEIEDAAGTDIMGSTYRASTTDLNAGLYIAIGIKNNSYAELYPLTYSETTSGKLYSIALYNYLSSSFYSADEDHLVELEIKGIIGQTSKAVTNNSTSTDEDDQKVYYTNFYWTKPLGPSTTQNVDDIDFDITSDDDNGFVVIERKTSSSAGNYTPITSSKTGRIYTANEYTPLVVADSW